VVAAGGMMNQQRWPSDAMKWAYPAGPCSRLLAYPPARSSCSLIPLPKRWIP